MAVTRSRIPVRNTPGACCNPWHQVLPLPPFVLLQEHNLHLGGGTARAAIPHTM